MKSIALCFFIIIPIFALAQVDLEVTKAEKEVDVGEFVTCVFNVKSKIEDTYNIHIKSPWKIINPPSLITLSPNEERKIFITAFIPESALAGDYILELALDSKSNPEIRSLAQAKIQVRRKPGVEIKAFEKEKRILAGEEVKLRFFITNSGNCSDEFRIESHSARGFRVDLSNRLIAMDPGDRKEVFINYFVPKDTLERSDFLEFKVKSQVLQEVQGKTNVLIYIFPRRIKGSIYKEASTNLSFNVYHSLGRKDYTYSSYLTSYANFRKDRFFALHLDPKNPSDSLRLDLRRKDRWELNTGNISPYLTPFTNFIRGKGVRFCLYKKPFESSFLRIGDYLGSDFRWEIPGHDIGLTYLNFPKDWVLSSSFSYTPFKRWKISGEYANSKRDKAWRLHSHLYSDNFSFDTQYRKVGKNYPGLRAEDGYDVYLRYYPFRSYLLKKNALLRLGFDFNKRDGAKKSLFSLSMNKRFGRFSSILSTELGERVDALERYDLLGYEMRLNLRLNKFHSFLNFAQDIEEGKVKKRFEERGIGFGYNFTPALSTWINLNWNKKRGYKYERISKEIDYRFREAIKFSFILERNRSNYLDPEWRVKLSGRINFGIPLPWVKEKGEIKGTAFIDKDQNNRFDKDEKGIPDLILETGGLQVITDKKGRFRFPPLEPGKYQLRLEDIPLGLASTISLPHNINLREGERFKLDIPLIESIGIEGIVFDDKNKNGKMDSGEEGIDGVGVVLIGSKISQKTFSNPNGKFSFLAPPGRYTIKVDELSLPKRHILTTKGEYLAELEFGKKEMVSFGLVEKEKEIIVTFLNNKQVDIKRDLLKDKHRKKESHYVTVVSNAVLWEGPIRIENGVINTSRIVRIVKKETRLVVLDDTSDKTYYKVELPDQTIGWIAYTYLNLFNESI